MLFWSQESVSTKNSELNEGACGTLKCENAAICEKVAKCEKKFNAKCEN